MLQPDSARRVGVPVEVLVHRVISRPWNRWEARPKFDSPGKRHPCSVRELGRSGIPNFAERKSLRYDSSYEAVRLRGAISAWTNKPPIKKKKKKKKKKNFTKERQAEGGLSPDSW